MARWIVCGVSYDRDDCTTLKVAAHAADELGARLAIVTALHAPPDGPERRAALADGRRAVADMARRCGVVDDAVQCVETGEPGDALARVSEELDAELIVVGRSRRSPFTSLLRAGVATRLSRRTARPVAVVPPHSAADPAAVRVLEGRQPSGATRFQRHAIGPLVLRRTGPV
jgi:nucleotide-binding universal stress UspA family protein